MVGLCQAPDPDLGMVQGLLGSVDCNVQTLAQAGYGALASPHSLLAPILTIALTLYIGFLGFRLMLGLGPLRVGELTMSVLKIGVIVALATSWPTYQQLVFDVLLRAPEQLGVSILQGLKSGAGLPAASPFAGLQSAYDQLLSAANFYGGKAPQQAAPMLGGAGLGAISLNSAAMLLLLNTLGPLLAAKIVLGMLLAIGPVFVVFLLFDSTRGLFEGWLRAALAFALVPLLAVLGLVMQLILLAPQLARLAELRERNVVDAALPSGVLLLCLIFTAVSAALLIAVGVVAFSFRLPSRRAAEAAALVQASGAQAATPPTPSFAATSSYQAPLTARPERAAQIALAAAALDRRDARASLAYAASGAAPAQALLARLSTPDPHQRRRAQPPSAASSQRRDR